ncbi:MAG: gamma-glutamyl-gamma-aminobutyrate hydrolase family protein [Acetobacteraceae bacterium]
MTRQAGSTASRLGCERPDCALRPAREPSRLERDRGELARNQQAIDRRASRLAVDAVAPGGTIEVVRVIGSRSFAFGVRWHLAWDVLSFADRTALLAAFGAMARPFHTDFVRTLDECDGSLAPDQ